MSMTWRGEGPAPARRRPGLGDWPRILRRGLPVLLLIVGGLALYLLLRLIERPFFGARRRWSPQIPRLVFRACLWCLGIAMQFKGEAAPSPAVVVANHASWLDILALSAAQPVTFVAKSEVAGWSGIGFLARAVGTIFIRRDRREAASQVALLREKMQLGERLAIFPEGTSSDGQRVLSFKPALFAAFLDGAPPGLTVQPVTIRWQAPQGEDPRFYAWWGEQDLGPHLLSVLAVPRHGRLSVIRHEPLRPEGQGRKALAADAEAMVRKGLETGEVQLIAR